MELRKTAPVFLFKRLFKMVLFFSPLLRATDYAETIRDSARGNSVFSGACQLHLDLQCGLLAAKRAVDTGQFAVAGECPCQPKGDLPPGTFRKLGQVLVLASTIDTFEVAFTLPPCFFSGDLADLGPPTMPALRFIRLLAVMGVDRTCTKNDHSILVRVIESSYRSSFVVWRLGYSLEHGVGCYQDAAAAGISRPSLLPALLLSRRGTRALRRSTINARLICGWDLATNAASVSPLHSSAPWNCTRLQPRARSVICRRSTNLAVLLFAGRVVARDTAAAYKLWKKAAAQGHVLSEITLTMHRKEDAGGGEPWVNHPKNAKLHRDLETLMATDWLIEGDLLSQGELCKQYAWRSARRGKATPSSSIQEPCRSRKAKRACTWRISVPIARSSYWRVTIIVECFWLTFPWLLWDSCLPLSLLILCFFPFFLAVNSFMPYWWSAQGLASKTQERVGESRFRHPHADNQLFRARSSIAPGDVATSQSTCLNANAPRAPLHTRGKKK